MSTTPPSSKLDILQDDGEAVLVSMGEVRFVAFNTGIKAIGTRNLGSCSVVVIASKDGALLAHIPPRPNSHDPDPYAGDNNVRRMMTEIESLHKRCKAAGYFADGDGVIVCAWYNGRVALMDQVQIMRQGLGAMGYNNPIMRSYDVLGNRDRPGQGSVHVDSTERTTQGKPIIYIEDRPI
ncbi:hypothetical protein BJY04DRAFT_222158 [Aspergillus karnatakaensis]|uniref:uncharacterized protein n=1 Tax=Aspergillus karnatakaensis TaxID=1810916 RepID=UPI003CCD2C6D